MAYRLFLLIDLGSGLFRNNYDGQFLGLPDKGHFCLYPDSLLSHLPMQIVDPGDGMTVESGDDIPLDQTCPLAGAIVLEGNNQNSGLCRQTVESNEAAMEQNVLTSQANVTPPDSPLFDQFSSHEFGRVHTYGETNPLGGENHGCIDADHFPPQRRLR